MNLDTIQRRGSRKTCAEVEGTGGVLVAAEDVAGIYFVLDVVEGGVVAVGYDGVALRLSSEEKLDENSLRV